MKKKITMCLCDSTKAFWEFPLKKKKKIRWVGNTCGCMGPTGHSYRSYWFLTIYKNRYFYSFGNGFVDFQQAFNNCVQSKAYIFLYLFLKMEKKITNFAHKGVKFGK